MVLIHVHHISPEGVEGNAILLGLLAPLVQEVEANCNRVQECKAGQVRF